MKDAGYFGKLTDIGRKNYRWDWADRRTDSMKLEMIIF